MCSKRTFTTYGLGGHFDLSAPRFLGGDNGAHLQVVVRVEPRCDVSEPSGTRRAAGVRQLVPARQAGRGEAVGCPSPCHGGRGAQMEMTGGSSGKEAGWPVPGARRGREAGLRGAGRAPGMSCGFHFGKRPRPPTAAHLPTPWNFRFQARDDL